MFHSTFSRIALSASLVAALAGSASAFASPQVRVVPGSLKVQGPGCPQDGSVMATITGNTTVQFLFNDLFAYSATGTAFVDQKNCVTTVDVEVPAGYRVAPGPVTMDATVTSVSETGSATVYARYFLDNRASELISKTLTAAECPADGQPKDLPLKSGDASQKPDAWSSSCGGIQKLNLQTRAIARRGQPDVGFTEVHVDRSVSDVNNQVACQLVLKPCGAP
jgi:hypothetical protein